MKEKILEVSKLRFKTPSNMVLFEDFSLVIDQGDRVGITGPSGCGKSTFLRSIIDSNMLFDSMYEKFNISEVVNSVGYVPQKEGLLPWYNLRQNLNVFSKDTSQNSLIIQELMLEKLLDRFPESYSGGEIQRAKLGLAMASTPDFYIVDEPLTEVDLSKKWKVLDFFSSHVSKMKSSLLIVSHDIDTLLLLCDKVIVLNGKPAKVRLEESIKTSYPRSYGDLTSSNSMKLRHNLINAII